MDILIEDHLFEEFEKEKIGNEIKATSIKL